MNSRETSDPSDTVSSATAATTIDNDRVRVTTWTFKEPGDSTGQHRHEHDYIVIPVTGGQLVVTRPDGTSSDLTQVAAVAYLGTAGTTHTVTAMHPLAFVEIELKT